MTNFDYVPYQAHHAANATSAYWDRLSTYYHQMTTNGGGGADDEAASRIGWMLWYPLVALFAMWLLVRLLGWLKRCGQRLCRLCCLRRHRAASTLPDSSPVPTFDLSKKEVYAMLRQRWFPHEKET